MTSVTCGETLCCRTSAQSPSYSTESELARDLSMLKNRAGTTSCGRAPQLMASGLMSEVRISALRSATSDDDSDNDADVEGDSSASRATS